jgi:hypothetical protein
MVALGTDGKHSGSTQMSSRIEVFELLAEHAPLGLCHECIADRIHHFGPDSLPSVLNSLEPSQFERLSGECAACLQVRDI